MFASSKSPSDGKFPISHEAARMMVIKPGKRVSGVVVVLDFGNLAFKYLRCTGAFRPHRAIFTDLHHIK
jgi:hypothetical protein